MVTKKEAITPVRKIPKVRQPTVGSDSSLIAPWRARKNSQGELVVPKNKVSIDSKTFFLVVVAFLAGSIITYSYTLYSAPKSVASTSSFAEITTGKVSLTERELIDAVKKIGIDVYWAGPVKDAKYTLAVPVEGQAYVRYLPNGDGLSDTKPNYVVIATYTTADAFTATQAAGNQTDGLTFINSEGAAVYYSKDSSTNVYVAYPNSNYQIEVFNPIATAALDIASKPGALKLVK